MRKRLFIGAIAALVIGVAAYVLSPPRKGSVEYHKRQYLKAYNVRPSGWRFAPDVVQDWYFDWYWGRNARQCHFHQEALIEAGYLREARITVSNRWSGRRVRDLEHGLGDIADFTAVRPTDTNAVVVVAPAEAFERVVIAIRQIDVAESN